MNHWNTCVLRTLAVFFLTTFFCRAVDAGNCTVCDDPRDAGVVSWCDASACRAGGAAPHLNAGAPGYCPALQGRIQEEGLTGCGPVTVTSFAAYSFCDGGARVYKGTDVDCAYVVHAENTHRGKIKERWYSGGGIAAVGAPTSQAYQVPGTEDLWFQMFEFGLVTNNADGSDAFYVGAENESGIALKRLYRNFLQEEEMVERFGMFPSDNSLWDADAETLYVLLQGGSGRATRKSALFAREGRAVAVGPEIYPRYADYDPNVADPDLFHGFLGLPLFHQAKEAGTNVVAQAFENGLLLKTGLVDKSQACIVCDDVDDGSSNAWCAEIESDTDCTSSVGCQWNAAAASCVGRSLDHCSPSPGGMLCPALTDRNACEDAQCDWDGSSGQCYNPPTQGAIAGRIAAQGWMPTDCGGEVLRDSNTGRFSQTCRPAGADHEVIWSPETECAYALHGGADARAEIRAKYETTFPARANNTSYGGGEIRSSAGNLYVVVVAGISGGAQSAPTGTRPGKPYVDGTARWQFLGAGASHGDLLGAPTSEAREIGGAGTDHWVQYFEFGALVFRSGDSEARRIGDPSAAGQAMKRRWRQDERNGKVIAENLFPVSDMGYVRRQGTILHAGTTTSPIAYFAFDDSAHRLGADALASYADYDSEVSNPDYAAGYLGRIVGDQANGDGSAGTWRYVELEHGVITDYDGAWKVHRSFAPQDDYESDDGIFARPYCMNSVDHELAMEMRRIKSGWGAWTGPRVSYTDDDPIDPPFVGGYYRMAGAGNRVVYSMKSNADHTECAYSLSGEIESKWASFSGTSRQNYGYPTSEQITIYDSEGIERGEAVLLQNGAIIHKYGDGAAYVLGVDEFTGYLRGRALKNLWRDKLNKGVVHEQGYYLDADASPGLPAGSGDVAIFEGIDPSGEDGDRYGRRVSVRNYNCGQHQSESSCPATKCEWGVNFGAEACVNRAFEVRGDINTLYRVSDLNHFPDPDYEAGALSYPSSERICGDPECTWVFQNFLGGQSIRYRNPGIAYVVNFGIEPCYLECDGQSSCSRGCRANFNGSGPQTCGAWGSCIACDTTNCPADASGNLACESIICDQAAGAATDLTSCAAWRLNNENDGDSDGIDDDVEDALAEHFRPLLRFEDDGDVANWIGSDSEHAICPDSDPECKQPYTVRPYEGVGKGIDCTQGLHQCIEITYGNLFNFDAGDFRYGFSRGAHPGDTEHYAILIARKDPSTEHAEDWFDTDWTTAKNDPSAWFIVKEFFAAHRCHFGTPDAEYSRFTRSMEDSLSTRNVRSEVWVAKGKHAAYPTEALCDGASVWTESCGARFNRRMDPAVMINVGEIACHLYNDHHIAPVRGGAGSNDGTQDSKPIIHQNVTGANALQDVWDPDLKYGDSTPPHYFLQPNNILWDTECWVCGEEQRCDQFLWYVPAD